MKKRSMLVTWGPVLLAALVVVLGFATGLLDKQRVFVDIAHTDMVFEDDDRRLSLEEGDSYGILPCIGPYYELPRGTYRLQWHMDADGANKIHLDSTNGALMDPQVVELPQGEWEGEFEFTVVEAVKNLQINVEFCSGTYMELLSLRMYSPYYKDNAFTLLFAAAGFSVLWLLYAYGRMTRRGAADLVLVGLAVLVVSSPAFKETLNLTHDVYFHLARIENIVSGLEMGDFPVRLGGYSYNGYGAITSVFYPDVFLYPLALMRMGGASQTYVMNVYYVAVNIVTAACMYVCAKRIFGNRWAGVFASILYLLADYRISNVFTRTTVGEMTAMAFMPLFVLGLWEVVLGDKRRWRVLTFGAASVFLCHLISTVLCAIIAVVFCLVYIRRIVREGRLAAIGKAALSTVLLCAFQLAPFIMYSAQGVNASSLKADVVSSALEPAQLFVLGEGTLNPWPKNSHILYFSVEIGLPLIICAAMALYAIVLCEKRGGAEKLAGLLLLGGVGFALVSTTLFPWEKANILTDGAISYIQFPWRLLMLTTLFFALAGGYGALRLLSGHADVAAFALLCAAGLAALPTLSNEVRRSDYIAFGEGGHPDLYQMEYLLPDTLIEWPVDHSVHIEGEATVTQYQKRETSVTAQVEAGTDATLSFPLFGFDGYAATVDGEPVPVGLGENNRLTVSLSAGTSGTLHIWFEGKAFWRIFDVLSLLTLLGLWGTRANGVLARRGAVLRKRGELQ